MAYIDKKSKWRSGRLGSFGLWAVSPEFNHDIPLFRQTVMVQIHVGMIFVPAVSPELGTLPDIMRTDAAMLYSIWMYFHISILPGL